MTNIKNEAERDKTQQRKSEEREHKEKVNA